MFNDITLADVDKINYESSFNLVKKTLANAADFIFTFVGNVDPETLKPLLEQYIATLPADAAHLTQVKELSSISTAKGIVNDEWKQPMQAPATLVYDIYSDSNVPYNIENATKIDLVGDLLSNIFVETLREEEGGTYSPGAGAGMSPITGEWQILYTFSTNAEMQDKIIPRAHEELLKLLKDGTDNVRFIKVKEAAIKQYENNIRTNRYWDSNLGLYLRGIDNITNAKSALENLTSEDINKFMKTLYNDKNRIQVIMEGIPTEEK